jgi:hypothetical protein
MALFSREDLAAFLQVDVSAVSDATYLLIERKIRVEITNLIGQSRFDAAGEAVFFSVALDMAKRLFQNSSGLRSEQSTIDDYTRTVTYASETVVPFEASLDEQRRIRKAAGLRNAFTIRIADECPRPAC